MRDVDARSALVQGAGFSAASLCRIAHLILRLVGRGIVSNTLVLVHGASLGTARVVIDSSQNTGRASAYAHPPPVSSLNLPSEAPMLATSSGFGAQPAEQVYSLQVLRQHSWSKCRAQCLPCTNCRPDQMHCMPARTHTPNDMI